MRIGIDGRPLTGPYTGDRTYWRGLISALLPLDPQIEYFVYTHRPIPEGTLPFAPNLRYRVFPSRNERIWSLFHLSRFVSEDNCSLLHVQYSIPFRCPCPVVTTVHDISFQLHPQWFPWKHRTLLQIGVAYAVKHAAKVITVSEASRQDILQHYQCPAHHVVAIAHGIAPLFLQPPPPAQAKEWVRKKYGIQTPFVLAVGVLQPRKNLETLAAAFGRVYPKFEGNLALVLVGKKGWGVQEHTIRRLVAERGGPSAATATKFTGYVPDEELPYLYAACSVFAYPSFYEGFGLPPLEAMACGAPTVVSLAPPMPEVVNDAALLVPPQEVEQWAKTLESLLLDKTLQENLRKRGHEQARHFSWEKTAQRTLQVYEEALGSSQKL